MQVLLFAFLVLFFYTIKVILLLLLHSALLYSEQSLPSEQFIYQIQFAIKFQVLFLYCFNYVFIKSMLFMFIRYV